MRSDLPGAALVPTSMGSQAGGHPSGYPDAVMFDTWSDEWRVVCFARWICRLDGIDARLAYFARLRDRHGAPFAERMRAMTQQQWATRAQWARVVPREFSGVT